MRFYQLLLHLYPATFRHAYGQEMEKILTRSLQSVRGAEAAFVWLRAAFDVLVNAPAVHADLLWQDLKYCQRSLSRTPGFAATVIGITALSVGAASAVLTLADRVFLHPLPFAEADQLVRLSETKPGYPQIELSPPNFRDWQAMSTSFSSVAAWRGRAVNLTGSQQPVHLEGAAVTANLFGVLGAQPILGRPFTAEDDLVSSPTTIILSEGLWREQFGADPHVIGRSVSLDNNTHIVIGVMPGWLQFPSRIARFWTPMRFVPRDFEDRADNYLNGIGRLRAGVSIEQARAEMRSIAANLERAYPIENAKTSASVVALNDQVGGQLRLMLWALCGASVCFLLIACMNLASLFMARALARRKELSIRTALGAGAERLVRQLATESLVLAVAGAVPGLLITAWMLPLLGQLIPESLPISIPELDAKAALLATLLSIGAGLLFGVLPAIRACRADVPDGLREGSRQGIGGRRQTTRSILVVAEVSLSVVLLV
ncbi:MAG: ABC transporter permease, partial [Bryobacteraceae bacterium]|nr:ABC transporter permease [Bryobacteraceae bacterium]